MAAYPRIPPMSSLMPQPWPAVSPLHTKLCRRGARPLLSARCRGRWGRCRARFLRRRRRVLEVISRAKRVLEGRFPAWILEVKSVAWLAAVPRSTRWKERGPRSGTPAVVHRQQAGHHWAGARRAGPQHAGIGGDIAGGDAGGRVSRLRTSATPDGLAARRWTSCRNRGGDGGSTGSGEAPLRILRRVKGVMGPWSTARMNRRGRRCERLNAAGLPPAVRAGCAEAIHRLLLNIYFSSREIETEANNLHLGINRSRKCRQLTLS